LESTIVEDGRVLRPGPISAEAIRARVGARGAEPSLGITAPGQLPSHYAPSKPVRRDATGAEAGEWLIGFGAVGGDATLSEAGDLVEAAARLFDRLHEAEAAPPPRIAVAPIPESGLGAATNDRLRRAAAPRPETS
jgi:L-threonylcarbamoyladenylate synthase